MTAYLQRMGHKFSLFDAPLVYNFSQASKTEDADLTKIFDSTLVKYEPVNAVVRVSDLHGNVTEAYPLGAFPSVRQRESC